ncbi:hypothetical protein BCON_0008g01100 [Botryotinia convoluta]|uniref:Uncharacterized protein n=1 Tax=Botryotinia convoluta TaxID=54673 RepID=A0A4Z1IRZ2_9HELO|nr:hypothetical protein BCON_0008g01100 [Botryotinia convoluta]
MPSETDPSVDAGGLFTTTSTANETIYYVAYRYAFIRPDKSHDDIIRKHVPKKIAVVADELIFVGNFKYCFTGHDIAIRCRKLIFIPRDDQPVEIDVSGPGLLADESGHMGGKFELSFKVTDAPINRGKLCFKILANGGQGGNGGKGGRGGSGGNGAVFDYDRQADNTEMLKRKPEWYKKVYSGGNGGKGRKGGAGGTGGNGGFIKICNAGTPEKDRQVLDAIFDLQARKGVVGTPGNPGDGGGGGASSNKPDIIIFYLASSSITDTPSQVQECAAYWHPDNLNPQTGSAGSKGDENMALT